MSFKVKQKGFTLIELMIVIAIIGLLSSIVLVSVKDASARARDAVRKQDMTMLKKALEAYWLGSFHYPTESLCTDSSVGCGGCGCAVSNFPNGNNWDTNSDFQDLIAEGYIGVIPVDPINDSTYHYRYEPDGIGQGSPACTVNSCRWSLWCRLETTGALYYVYSDD